MADNSIQKLDGMSKPTPHILRVSATLLYHPLCVLIFKATNNLIRFTSVSRIVFLSEENGSYTVFAASDFQYKKLSSYGEHLYGHVRTTGYTELHTIKSKTTECNLKRLGADSPEIKEFFNVNMTKVAKCRTTVI